MKRLSILLIILFQTLTCVRATESMDWSRSVVFPERTFGRSETSCALGQCPAGPFTRTYTGHEELWQFGLLNANARLYNPYIGRFISPDPLLNSEGGPLDFNPYVYARNNPYSYIDRNGEFWWAVPILFGALMNGSTYSISAALSGNWNAKDFFKSMGIGAVTATIGIGTSLLHAQLGTFGQSLTYAMLAGMANNTITNAIFGERMSVRDIPGILTSAAISSVLPKVSPNGTNLFKNSISEIGFNTLRGGLAGTASGAVNALVHDDISLIGKGAMGGAISGFSRSVLSNVILGSPIKYNGNFIGGTTFRKGGLSELIRKSYRDSSSAGFTLGQHSFIHEGYGKEYSKEWFIELLYHEDYHAFQQRSMGVSSFYEKILLQYIKDNVKTASLEKEVDAYVDKILKGNKRRVW